MTAATATPEQVVTRARETYQRVENAGWPRSVWDHIGGTAVDLRDALEEYGALQRREYRGDDQPGDPEPEWTALREAAQAVADQEAELIRICPDAEERAA